MTTQTNTVLSKPETAARVVTTIERLQSIGDRKRVDDVVYGWLKANNISVPEDASEALAGTILGLIGRVRDNRDQPSSEEIFVVLMGGLVGGNAHAEEHNASPHLKTKLALVDPAVLDEVLNERAAAAVAAAGV